MTQEKPKTQLASQRLLFRPWQESDIKDLVEGLNNLEVSKWLALVPYPYTEESAQDFINYCQITAADDTSYEWAIVLKEENKVIGGTSLRDISFTQLTSDGGGLWLNPKYHGHGFGTEALNLRADFAFNTLGLRRISNGFFVGNEASKRMQEKIGYKVEGLERQAYICTADGQIKDVFLTGLLKEEWLPQ